MAEPSAEITNYLRTLSERLLHLALGDLDIWQAVNDDARINLKDLFTEGRVAWQPLDERLGEEGEDAVIRTREDIPEKSVTAFAFAHDRAVLLGDPGSGKSTYVSMLALCHAGSWLAHADVNLSLLPDWEASHLPPLLPLHLVLREYAGSGVSLWDHVVESLPEEARAGQSAAIRDLLLERGGLFLLDGLDEVPEAHRCREELLKRIGEFREAFPQVRLLVTSRTYAYERDGWRLEGFEDTRLQPFNEDERAAFLQRWFEHAGAKRGLKQDERSERRQRLAQHIEQREHLRHLAENPLLLTLICLHDFQSHGHVPEDREELYSKSVDLLLEIWQKPRLIDPGTNLPYDRLEDYLGVERKALQRQLERLALQFHEEQGDKAGLADIPRGRFLDALAELGDKVSLDVLKKYVEDRAGLLSHHGSIYRFAHRTFQEYLAARELSNKRYNKIVEQVREEPQTQWREVYLLAGAKKKIGGEDAVWGLLDATVPEVLASPTEADWRMAALAARLLCETRLSPETEEDQEILERIQTWLMAMIKQEALPAKERLVAAMDLGHLGDPRLSKVDWIPIAKGDFVYQGQPAQIETDYAISRYPITVAQYQDFIEDGGYQCEDWWHGQRRSGDAWNGRSWLQENQGPEDYGDAFQTANHPRVGVCCYEAMAFCQWLSNRLDCPVHLPTEEQWERAAAGAGNPPRRYPWGGSEDDDRKEVTPFANCYQAYGAQTTPVGFLPRGNTPDGIADLSGNVWEWCENNDENDRLALRGGSWLDVHRDVRAAARFHGHAEFRSNLLGFRVVSSPILSKG